MALKRLKNGQFKVSNLQEAKEALEGSINLAAEISDLMKEHGIQEMMEDAAEMKKAATAWAANTDTQRIDLGTGRKGQPYALLRKDKYGGTWVATEDDLENAPVAAIPLVKILRKKFHDRETRSEVWNRITRRVVDPDALSREVDDGVLTTDEIAPAFFEKEKAPFLMIIKGK